MATTTMYTPHHFTFTPKGPFDLLNQNQYFNGWPLLDNDQKIVMTFPVEAWQGSAAVTLRQTPSGELEGEIYGPPEVWENAKKQALAAMSLDEDGSGWAEIGKHDPFVDQLQKTYKYMRPTLFHSPYEAAAAFIIGHRISIVQTRALRQKLAEAYGEKIEVDGRSFFAFPEPAKLLTITEFKGLNEVKLVRLHAVAQAALDGWLDRDYLRALPEEDAIQKLETLPGVGPFFSQGILYRGVGIKDGLTHEDIGYQAIQTAYPQEGPINKDAVLKITEGWQPYRMWAMVLLHVWLRSSGNMPKRSFSKR